MIFCLTQMKNILLLLFTETLHYSRKGKSSLIVLISNFASQVHINYLNRSLNFKPWFENLKLRFENVKPRFERKSAH